MKTTHPSPDLMVGQLAQTTHRTRLIDHSDAISVDVHRTLQEIANTQWNFHTYPSDELIRKQPAAVRTS